LQASIVCVREGRLNDLQVAQQAREEPEVGPLFETCAQFLVVPDKGKCGDSNDLGEIERLCGVARHAVGIRVVLQQKGDEPGQGVDAMEHLW